MPGLFCFSCRALNIDTEAKLSDALQAVAEEACIGRAFLCLLEVTESRVKRAELKAVANARSQS